MIHSLAGGVLSDNKPVDFVKVEILNDYYSGSFWYVCEISGIKENDIVLVPFKDNGIVLEGKVLRVDKNVLPNMGPISLKRAKKVISKKI